MTTKIEINVIGREKKTSLRIITQEDIEKILPTLQEARTTPTCHNCKMFKHKGACEK